MHGRAARLERDRQHEQAGQQQEADPGKLALLGLWHFQLWQARRLDPKALPRGGALGARDPLTPGFHTGWVAATSAVTNGAILTAIRVPD